MVRCASVRLGDVRKCAVMRGQDRFGGEWYGKDRQGKPLAKGKSND